MELGVDLADLVVELGDAIAKTAHLRDQALPLLRILRLADRLRAGVAVPP